MTPADHVDPPSSPFRLINQQEDQGQLFISANPASSSLSCPSFYTVIRDQRGTRLDELSPNDHEDGAQTLQVAGSSNHQMNSTSPPPDMDENGSSVWGHNLALHKWKLQDEDQPNIKGSAKWMPSKIRLMHKMMTANRAASEKTVKFSPRLQNQQHGCSEFNGDTSSASHTGNTTRVCSDCNTTTTPLWRSGPGGPKSLCNACGIRQRKQRKAMAEASAASAANGSIAPKASSSAKISRIMHSKEKKPRSNSLAQNKNKSRPAAAAGACASQRNQPQQLSFRGFKLSWSSNSAFQQAFPQDEVAEAAILLMELSCGFVQV